MATKDEKRQKFIALLHTLFQLDQPDLDFGFYRIMHAKAGQVTRFLEEELLDIIRKAFGEADEARIAEARESYEAARKQAEDFGAPDPDAAPKVREAKEVYDAVKDSGSNEGDVYDHLYRFFERYYDNGDFMSRRYFARETDGKAAPYAVPYDGREVYLHWANRDQYYIKTSEYLSNFTFDPTQAKEYLAHHGGLLEHKPLKVHCRIVAATEGEHNNVKASEQTERYFIIHEPEPVRIETGDSGAPELVIQFQYRADPEKTGQEGTWRKKRLAEAAEVIKTRLPELAGADDYVAALTTPAPTEAEKGRTLLEKYLAQYTARNTMDYFIHKDLGGFLRRELDFYIKNEVMRLDDIESAEAPRVETYLAKVKVLRRIGRHLIDFLAQLEDFQKKLWLKKKFVVDTQYCITLDRIPEAFYPEIAANEAQREEWVRLFAIDELNGYSEPLTLDFVAANKGLVLDTWLFDADFRLRLIASIEQLDEQCDGLLIHSDNFQALKMLELQYEQSIRCIYIDPPYNTGNDGFIYKDGYSNSTWMSMFYDRVTASYSCLSTNGAISYSLDDKHTPSSILSIQSNGVVCHTGSFVWKTRNTDNRVLSKLSTDHEYVHVFQKPGSSITGRKIDRSSYKNPDNDERGPYTTDPLTGKANASDRPNLHYEIVNPDTGDVYPPDPDFGWITDKSGFEALLADNRVYWPENPNTGKPRKKRFASQASERAPVSTMEIKIKQGEGNIDLSSIMGSKVINFPKPVSVVKTIIDVTSERDSIILDYFAGSGTTAHAVMNLNREDTGSRKYIVVEMGSYFDSILKPRAAKVVYSDNWKDGKPTARDTGISHCFKYLRLESYEDTLANLRLDQNMQRATAVAANPAFKQDYMLHYWLDFETKGSPSLLNIQWFTDPTAYKLKVKKPGTDEYVEKAVDLVETFNWLIGLHVEHLDRWRGYTATFKREVDADLPGDTNTRLMLDGTSKETDDGQWHFRKVEGYTLRSPGDQNDREKVLVVWRKLTGDLEQDNLMLDEWFRKYRLNSQDSEFDVIFVNGSNNLPNIRRAEETWKVRLIEEAFHQAMWDVEDA
ncbi:site-specific DNA-methyltransferase [Thiohalocapsa marina]|uniref:site-specific DNA-methyltransferase (adenine-specific) n=1 Tax=Thiohalocapsa marina TaxID=424902 RepID=A0A5M8FT75_9GAMM|nr:site-specific DNA-methyltransferase [Thiohalocapsa marina]KAA6186998.1 site-specific DNA-methyltransferase [Thiohalocapsa marina]